MKHVIILSAAVAAVACLYASPTANEDFVVSEDARTYTNAVNAAKAYADMATNAAVNAANAYTDAATNALNAGVTAEMVTNIVNGVAPAPGNYAAVSNAAMNAAQNATNYTDALRNDLDFGDFTPWRSINSDYADEAIGLRLDSGIVRDADDISTQLDAATTTNAQQSTQLTTLAGQVATIGAHLNAEDARFVVTNYNSVTHTPEAYVEIQLPDESWSRIWSEMTRWNYLFNEYLPTNYYDKAAVNAALADKADRAWGFYDSTTGAYAPDGYTWISSEKIAIAANLAYQRTVTAEGAIWVLESNGVVTETGGMTNGFFRISDDEGNSLFEIVKGNKRTVGADASSCQIVAGFTPTKLQIGYSVVGPQPVIYVCNSLTTQNWKAETDSDCLANVSWSGESGAWIAQVQGKTAQSSLFVKATYEVGGETYISNAAPVSMQYMMINGVKYAVGVGTVSGTTVLTLTVAQ